MQASLRAAAKRMRATGKPVGMIVWGRDGGHAWVMTGFRATADPKNTSDYTVTSVQAMGPLWPLGTINGKPFDPGPRTGFVSTLRRKFTRERAAQRAGVERTLDHGSSLTVPETRCAGHAPGFGRCDRRGRRRRATTASICSSPSSGFGLVESLRDRSELLGLGEIVDATAVLTAEARGTSSWR